MNKVKSLILVLILTLADSCIAQSSLRPQEQMQFLGAYNAGQPDVNIYKMYDKVEDVLCYVMMPTYAQRRQLENGQIVYEANTVGALSCMKAKLLPVQTSSQSGRK